MQSFTKILNDINIKKIKEQLSKYQKPVPNNPYIMFFFKTANHTISIFHNNKMLIQGNNPSNFYDELINAKTLENRTNQKLTDDYIGCDEVGVGDYFGGIVTCAVYLKKTNEVAMRNLGVCDSKHITDQNMKLMFNQIINLCEYEYKMANPKRYNQLVALYKNAHIVKAFLHDQCIKKLTKRLKIKKEISIVMDQFAPKNTYYQYFKEINLVPHEITHFETKAENKYLAVAAASVIARVLFLKQIDDLSLQAKIKLLLGASNPEIIEQARKIYRSIGKMGLAKFAKIDFATTKKVIG
ncbi:MAG: ribonuclease HIII [Mycoplasmataceae bacterium]|jgi:ribonuclease HIII|nr:ribonuclease HIII [Mycoplasmataceae bacterium]